jgi:hypothetical protein
MSMFGCLILHAPFTKDVKPTRIVRGKIERAGILRTKLAKSLLIFLGVEDLD